MNPYMGDIPLRVTTRNWRIVPLYPEECEEHTPHPDGYVQHLTWMDGMAQTHAQRQCLGCGLWAIWEPSDHPEVERTQPVDPA